MFSRLQRARRLLAETDLPLQVVAERSGVHYAKYMSTTFRKRMEVTPGLFCASSGATIAVRHGPGGLAQPGVSARRLFGTGG